MKIKWKCYFKNEFGKLSLIIVEDYNLTICDAISLVKDEAKTNVLVLVK